ncbi:MAG: hypothetical protein FWF13_01040 [Acidobacteria bacterium]|nr:hypothetical protein [Acidobacteriota bacterium]
MARFPRICFGFLILGVFFHGAAFAQQMRSMSSKHVILQFPAEREILVRELSAEAERCYEYMNRATNNGLPRNISVTLDWNATANSWNFRSGRVTIGMSQPEAVADARKFLRHDLPFGIARLGLINLSQGAQREDTEFLFEGMAEILTHEYNHSTRSLEAAWATAKLLDETGRLGFSHQRAWSEFSGGKRNHRNAAPGISFLLTQRETDRGRLMKFFEALRKNSLLNALSMAFKAPAAELEAAWLKKVRSYEIPAEITVQSVAAPILLKIEQAADSALAGRPVRLNLLIKGSAGDIYPENIFVRDSRSGKTFQARNADSETEAENEVLPYSVIIQCEDDCLAGTYSFEVIMIDDAGNLRRDGGTYTIK